MYDHHILWLSVFSHVNNTKKDRFSRCKWYENNFALSAFGRYWLLEHVLYTIRMYKIINLSYLG